MKKFLSFAVVAAVLAVSVGCDDKKTTAPAKPATTGAGTGTGAGGAGGAATKTS